MTTSSDKVGPYQFFMLVLCLMVLLALGVDVLFDLDPEVAAILSVSDTAVCGIFLFDFLKSLWSAEKKGRYFITWGWIDLISSIPAVGFLRWGRAARAARILRVLRGVRSARVLGWFILEKRAQSTTLVVALGTLLAVVFSSIAMLNLERGLGGTIQTGPDALWWAIETVTTIGYGDYTPVTPGGRLVAVGLMTVGISLFTTLTAFLATWFLAGSLAEERRTGMELAQIREELQAIRRAVENR
jgi:voltage-gated potassium channel